MNKFIRTKEGKIFDLENKKVSSWEYIDNDTAINEYGVEGAFYIIYYFDENEGHYSEYDDKGGHSCDFIEEKDIIKQANTINELCDGFYIDDGQEEFCLDDVFTNFDKFKSVCEYNNRYCAGKYEGYGFIKTPKGLVYVAKMNNKEGDLELIWVNN